VQTAQLTDLRRAWEEAKVSPLWENALVHNAGSPRDHANLWPWHTMKPLVDEVIKLKGMDVVERRVLSLVDPHPRFEAGPSTVVNLTAGLQILGPGETARPHRHSMNALRFVLHGSGATTIVDGKRCPMNEGDLVLTPGWTWHEHEHEGAEPIVWLDVLDAQLHRYLGTDAFEPGPVHDVPDASGEAYHFPWADAVTEVSRSPRGRDRVKRVRYRNPKTGGPVMLTLDCYIVEIEPGVETVPLRTSSHAVCAVMEGSGASRIGDDEIAWGPKDVFSLPNQRWTVHRAGNETVRLFVVTDQEVLRRLEILTEEYAE
jgi:gentisate 1,2-dioxygenase